MLNEKLCQPRFRFWQRVLRTEASFKKINYIRYKKELLQYRFLYSFPLYARANEMGVRIIIYCSMKTNLFNLIKQIPVIYQFLIVQRSYFKLVLKKAHDESCQQYSMHFKNISITKKLKRIVLQIYKVAQFIETNNLLLFYFRKQLKSTIIFHMIILSIQTKSTNSIYTSE